MKLKQAVKSYLKVDGLIRLIDENGKVIGQHKTKGIYIDFVNAKYRGDFNINYKANFSPSLKISCSGSQRCLSFVSSVSLNFLSSDSKSL